MDDNKQFWERFSRHYAGFMRRSQATYQQICKAMHPFLKRDMDVLELACGTGQLSIPLSPCVRSWEATDFSSEMIRQAKKQVYSSRLHFSVQDATKLPYGPESFDAVVISNALHVMPHPEKALAEAWRVLKPGGWLFAPTFVWGKSRSARLQMCIRDRTATEDACRIEHVISEKSFAAVQAHLEQVTKMREDAHGQ